MSQFKRKFLANLIAAGIAVGMSGAAAAADEQKTPTLGEVLKASRITMTGYLDVSLDSLSSDSGTPSLRVFDQGNHGFDLHTVDVTVAKVAEAAPRKRLGWFVQADAGSDANVYATNSTGGDDFEIQEAWFDYKIWLFDITAGKFATLAGAEVIESPQNTNYSRSFLFGYAIPFTHTGVRAATAYKDLWRFTVGFNNGWDVLDKAASTPTEKDAFTTELGFSVNPADWMSFAFAWYAGTANTIPGGISVPDGDRELYDFVVTLKPMEDLSFIVNYDMGFQDRAAPNGIDTAEWDGWAAYLNYTVTDGLNLSFRSEQFNDDHGARTGVAQELEESTFTIGVPDVIAKDIELRFEYRKDQSNQQVWTDAGQPTGTQTSVAMEALVKF